VGVMSEQGGYISFNAGINAETREALINAVLGMMHSGKKEIHLMLSTGGGGIIPGFEIYNTLRALPIKLVTHNMGSVNSIGNVVFLAADERYASPASTFMFHGVTWGVSGEAITRAQAKELLGFIEADERRLSETIAERTKLSVEDTKHFFEAADTLGAERALEAGIVSAIRVLAIPAGSEIAVVP
jgi:ATP-dependent Clp protease, protease subunit